MPKENKPDVDVVVLKETTQVANKWNSQYRTGDDVNVFWEGNPWVTLVPKNKEYKTVVIPMGSIKKLDLL